MKTIEEKREQIIRIMLKLSNKAHEAMKLHLNIEKSNKLHRRITRLRIYAFNAGLEVNSCAIAQYRREHPLRTGK